MISTGGAISARWDADPLVITPPRRDPLNLQPGSLVCATKEPMEAGKQGSRSSRLNAFIYAANPEVGVSINAQPMCASASCMADAEFSSRTIPKRDLVRGDTPKVTFACVVKDAEALAARISLKKYTVLLIESDGALIVGRTLLESLDRREVLEPRGGATAEPASGPLVAMPDTVLGELRRVYGMA